MEELKENGVGCSVHWRPLHLHPLYAEELGWQEDSCPIASQLWERLVSLPIFPSMETDEISQVVKTVKKLCLQYSIKKNYSVV